jgi:hypothetical protein
LCIVVVVGISEVEKKKMKVYGAQDLTKKVLNEQLK